MEKKKVLLQAQLDPGVQKMSTDPIFSHSIFYFGFLHVNSIFRQPLSACLSKMAALAIIITEGRNKKKDAFLKNSKDQPTLEK